MTPKRQQFCFHYAKNPNAEQAAIDAGFSKQYAKSNSYKLLDDPDIIAEIKRIRMRMNERAEKSATDVVNEYAKIAFTDRVDFLKEDELRPGEYIYKAPHELSDAQRAIVEKVNTTRREIRLADDSRVWRQEYTYVLSDKANALQQMGRHFGIFDDKLKLIGSHQNPFKHASPEQLEQLRKSWVETMNQKAIEGDYERVEK